MSKALLVEADEATSAAIQEALADAGCVDTEAATLDEAIELVSSRSGLPDLIVLRLEGPQLARLHRLARTDREIPIVVICDECHIDAAYLAGAVECATLPLRQRELLGRIRAAMRVRDEARHRANRERRLSETIVALQQEKQDLKRVACVDALTGIANRRHALSMLQAEWRRSSREHLPLGLVMIDLDCYHAYNEQYGHLGGDKCLQLVCGAMVDCLRRPSDFVGRYGGEEFIAVLPNTDAAGAKIVADRLRASVEALAIPHEASVCSRVVTITAGFASLRVTSDLTMDRLIAVADAALLRAKAQGRNRIEGDAPLIRPSRMSAQRWQRFAPVIADPWFVEKIPAFLSETHAGARAIVAALRADRPLAIHRTASMLRSSARELGLGVVERLIGDLERAAVASDVPAAREAADEVIQYVTHVQVVYRRAHEEAGAPSRTGTSH